MRRLALAAGFLLPLPCALLVLALPAAATERELSGERAFATVRQLDALGPRPAGSATERRASALAEGELRALGYRVVVQPFALPRGGVSRNVVGLTGGPARVVLVAHVDGVRAGPAANDNGSGVAVLLELARALRGRPGVVLAVTGAEERVETRSRIHLGAQRLLRGLGSSVRLAVALDMLGYGPMLTVRGVEAEPNRSAAALLEQARTAGVRAFYLRDRGESDHAELTRGGIPAAWVEWRDDPCWHRACDRFRRVDPARMQTAGELVLAAARAVLRG